MSSVTIGTIRKTQKGSILVLNKGITVLYEGKEIEIDPKYRTLSLFDSEESANTLASKGYLDTEGLGKKLAYIKEKSIIKDVVAFVK